MHFFNSYISLVLNHPFDLEVECVECDFYPYFYVLKLLFFKYAQEMIQLTHLRARDDIIRALRDT